MAADTVVFNGPYPCRLAATARYCGAGDETITRVGDHAGPGALCRDTGVAG